MDPEKRLVAIVDDDPGVLRALGRLVRSLGFEADTYTSSEALLARASAAPPDEILLDLHLSGLRGPEVILALRRRQPNVRVVVMTGLDQPGSREACLGAGAAAYVTKPLRRADLSVALGRPERLGR